MQSGLWLDTSLESTHIKRAEGANYPVLGNKLSGTKDRDSLADGLGCLILLASKDMIVVTNNELVENKFNDGKYNCEVVKIDGTYRDVLVKVRDLIHVGHKLLTHPLMGSIKPNETPYRSVAVSKHIGQAEMDDILLIEKAIMTFDKFALVERPNRGENATSQMKADYAEIDLSLISSALDR